MSQRNLTVIKGIGRMLDCITIIQACTITTLMVTTLTVTGSIIMRTMIGTTMPNKVVTG